MTIGKALKRLRFWPRIGVRLRVLLICHLIVLPLVAYRLAELNNQADKAYDEAWVDLEHTAQFGSERFLDVVDDARTMLQVISHIPEVSRGSGTCNQILATLQSDRPWVVGFHVANQSGTIICSSSEASIGVDISDRRYFQEALRGRKFVVGDYMIGRRTGMPQIGTAMTTGRDGVLNVFVATINTSFFQSIALQIGNHANLRDRVMLIDGTGMILAQYPPDEQGSVAFPNLARELVGAHNRLVTADVRGEPQLMVSTIIPRTRARLVVSRNQAETSSTVAEDVRKVVTRLGFLAVLTLVLVWFYADIVLIRPLRAIAKVAARIGGGDLEARVGKQPWAIEFMQLGTTVDRMGENLTRQVLELNDAQEKLHAMAMIDSLTGIANRRSLETYARTMLATAAGQRQEVACILIDVDFFKKFNDRYGHAAGDDALQEVAKVMATHAGLAGGLAARIGGEEFAVLLTGTEAMAHLVAVQIHDSLHRLEIAHADSATQHLTASLGVCAALPDERFELRTLLMRADEAMYTAKMQQRDQIVRASTLPRRTAIVPRSAPVGSG